MNNWIEISHEHLAANFRSLTASAGSSTEVLAVVKANAYGHGAEACAPLLVRAGARWLGVTCAAEGARVRGVLAAAGLRADILIMCGFLPEDVPVIRSSGLIPVVWTPEQIEWLASLGQGQRLHIEVDTGMGRQGVTLDGLRPLLLQAVSHGLAVDGVFTHFCSSEQAGSELTQRQQTRFEQAVAIVRELQLAPAWIHAGNSSTLDNPAQTTPWLASLASTVNARAMVRSGLALFGYTLPIEGDAPPQVKPALNPVMLWKARILAVRDLEPGDTVGYNATFTASEPLRVALLPVGYADGLRRELSSGKQQPASPKGPKGGWVMFGEGRAPILGRVSMNLTVVDVTASPHVQAGDVAVVLGPGITADDHARLADTIAYEILCGIHPCG